MMRLSCYIGNRNVWMVHVKDRFGLTTRFLTNKQAHKMLRNLGGVL